MVTPKTASRLSGITVAVGLGVAVTTGQGVASADSSTDSEEVGGPPTSAPAETTPPSEETKDPGANVSPAAAAQQTAQQRRAATRAALREQVTTVRRHLTDGNAGVRGGNQQSREQDDDPADAKSEVSGTAVERKGGGVTARRVTLQPEEPPQIKQVMTEIEQVTTRVRTTVARPRASSVTANAVTPIQLSSANSSASSSSAAASRVVAPVPTVAPTGMPRITTVLMTLSANLGLRPNAATPVAPRVPTLPGLLELAYAAWRRVVVPRVFNSTPTATATVNYKDRDPLTGEVDGAVVGRDADNDRLTYQVVRGPETGTLDFNDDGTFNYTPDKDVAHQPNPEDVTFTVRVSDEGSRPHLHLFSRTQHSTTTTVTIDVEQLNQAPTVKVTKTEPQADGSIRYTVDAKDPDEADQSSLAVTWTDPAGGTVTPVVGTTNVYTYTPDPDYAHTLSAPKEDPFAFVVTDQYGKTGSVEVAPLVQPVNSAPELTVLTPQRQSNGSYTIGLLATDTDGDSVRVTPPTLDAAVGSWQGLDADGTVTLTPNTIRAITFVPKPVTDTTTRTFDFKADDGHYLGTDTAQTSLTLAPNRAPNFVITNVSAPDATTGAVTITYTKSDPDGDPVTLTATDMDANAKFVDNGNGTATYSPDRAIVRTIGPGGTASTDTFTITASDGFGGNTPRTVDASVIFTNQKPIAVFSDDYEVLDPVTGKIRGKVTIVDPDGDPARFTFASTSPAAPESSTPGTLEFDKPTGVYTFTPKDSVRDAQPGEYRMLIVTVEDDFSLVNTGSAVLYIVPKPTVIIINNPPPNLPGTSGPLPV